MTVCRALLVAVLMVGPLWAGCLEGDASTTPAADDDDGARDVIPDDDLETQRTSEPQVNGTSDGDASTGNASWPPWPDLADAPLRPGVGLGRLPAGAVPALDAAFGTSSCTANFVFRTPDNASLFLGTASHCLVGLSVGDRVPIGDDGRAATLAYCSWGAMDGASGCPDHADLDGPAWWNDFALLRVDDADRGLVHPAVLHFGGPTGVAGALAEGDRVLSFGNSSYREASDAVDAREGYVWSQSQWLTEVQFLPPGIPGDSGSAVLTPDGGAVGLLKYLIGTVEPKPVTNGVVNLVPALAFAAEQGFEVELCTWPLMDGGALPDPPGPWAVDGAAGREGPARPPGAS